MGAHEQPVTDYFCRASTRAKTKRRIAWDVTEIIVGYGLILSVIWTHRPLQHWLYFVALGWFIVSMSLSFEGWRGLGCSTAGFWKSWWVVGVALLMGAGAVLLASSMHTLHHPGSPMGWIRSYAGYTVWALTQQLLLQGYFLARILRIVSNTTLAAFLSGSVFALAHLPNPILTPLTLVWGLAACFVFLRSRNLYPLAIAHAIFGISVAISIPATILHNMRVGLGYIEYHPPRIHLSQSDHVVSTVAWVTADAPMRR